MAMDFRPAFCPNRPRKDRYSYLAPQDSKEGIVRATFRNLFQSLDAVGFVRERHDHAMSVLRWLLILVRMAAAVKTLCAAFLWTLDAATRLRFAWPWLLWQARVCRYPVHLPGALVQVRPPAEPARYPRPARRGLYSFIPSYSPRSTAYQVLRI
jgi:hypothetical protein